MKPLAFLIFLLILPIARAQFGLPPGETGFVIGAIVLSPVDDYTGTKQFIGLFGTKQYLNVFWDASYNPALFEPVGAICFLNCPANENIDENCVGYQNCSYEGGTGKAGCSIQAPIYDYKSQNSVKCEFYDPNLPEIEFLPYPNRTFMPISFIVSTAGGTFTVGKAQTWPVSVASRSLLAGNYTVNVTSLNPAYLLVTEGFNTTQSIGYGEVVSTYPKLNFLSTVDTTLRVLVKAGEDPSVCSTGSDCSVLVYGPNALCLSAHCWKQIQIPVKSGYASLSEYGWPGFLQIVGVATIIFAWFLLKT